MGLAGFRLRLRFLHFLFLWIYVRRNAGPVIDRARFRANPVDPHIQKIPDKNGLIENSNLSTKTMPKKRSRVIECYGLAPPLVRSLAHRLGYRFRLHDKELPGRPHLLFPARRCAVFTVACDSYPHDGCLHERYRASSFQQPHIERNMQDLEIIRGVLEGREYRCVVVWACEMLGVETIATRLIEALGPPPSVGPAEVAEACAAIRATADYDSFRRFETEHRFNTHYS
jgi:DNA mismatch endonuclease Vsr